jgi:hypothetical protein
MSTASYVQEDFELLALHYHADMQAFDWGLGSDLEKKEAVLEGAHHRHF